MKHSHYLIIVCCALTMSLIGCSTTKSTEDMLAAAGFKEIPAATAQQQMHLKALPPDKVSTVIRRGTNYFIFPDVKNGELYVGQDPQYQEYQKLRLEKQMAAENAQAADLNGDEMDMYWGPWR